MPAHLPMLFSSWPKAVTAELSQQLLSTVVWVCCSCIAERVRCSCTAARGPCTALAAFCRYRSSCIRTSGGWNQRACRAAATGKVLLTLQRKYGLHFQTMPQSLLWFGECTCMPYGTHCWIDQSKLSRQLMLLLGASWRQHLA
jgi:hypothetical protein